MFAPLHRRVPIFARDDDRRVRRQNTNGLRAGSASSYAGGEWLGQIVMRPIRPHASAVFLLKHERHFRFKRAMLGTLGEDRPASQPYLRFPPTSGQAQGRFRYFVLRYRADPRPNRCRRGSRLPTRLLLNSSPPESTGARRRTLWPFQTLL